MAASKQLISQFNPDSYLIELDLNKQEKYFSGKLVVKGVRRAKPSYRITFNQNGLKISSARIFKQEKDSRTELKITRIVHHAKLQEVRLHTENQVTSGAYEVELKYSGKIATKGTSGIYTSTWPSSEGEQREIITTQFEPHYARGLLPCIDEPQAKAVFSLSLTVDAASSKDTVLFNTKPSSESEEGSKRRVTFNPTPVMSTYLLALVIGELEAKSAKSKNGTQINVYSTPNKLQSTDFALEFSVKALDFLEDKFQTKYPLDKLDLVAIPDFESSAGMENWGLIICREDYLLYDENIATLTDKQAIAQVIAHEIAHQWFGNLVTMKWWDELWLNEGFANFIEFYLVDQLFPDWKMLENYLIAENSYAVRLDSLPSSRPIINKVTSPHHAVEVFDGIAYEKSGSIIRMIFGIMGEGNFMLGLKDYFAKFSYKSASSQDLLVCWQKYTKLNLLNFTKAWLHKPGLPLLEVHLGLNPGQIILEQSRFLSEPKPKPNLKKAQEQARKAKPNVKKKQMHFYQNHVSNQLLKEDQTIWDIPISFVGGELAKEDFVMTKLRHTIQLPKDGQLPLKLNRDGSGFYVTSYSLEFLIGIAQAIKDGEINDLDTLNLLSDMISLSKATKFKPGTGAILDIIKSGKDIPNPQFWSLTGGFIGYLHHHLKQVGKTKLLNSYICDLIAPSLADIDFESSARDHSSTTIIRFELLSLAALAKDPYYTAKFIELYEDSKGHKVDNIESEKRLLSLYAVAKRGKKSDYKDLLQNYKDDIGDASLRDDLSYALCLFEDAVSVSNNLAIMQDSQLVRTQDILSWLSQIISAGQSPRESVLEWVTKQNGWEWLSSNLSSYDLSTAIKIVISTAFNTKDLNKLKKFFENLQDIELEKALHEACDIARSRISWHKKELPNVVNYLS